MTSPWSGIGRWPERCGNQPRVSTRTSFSATELDLATALHAAERWWAGVVATSIERAGNFEGGLRLAFTEFFAGPGGFPEVQYVVHHYWLACVELAASLPEHQRLPPETVLLAWLLDGRHDSWLPVFACMPYWPLGLDAEGNWI